MLGFSTWDACVEILVMTTLFEEDPPCLGRRIIEDTTYLMNISDKILLVLKFELTQKYSARKSQHF